MKPFTSEFSARQWARANCVGPTSVPVYKSAPATPPFYEQTVIAWVEVGSPAPVCEFTPGEVLGAAFKYFAQEAA